MKKLIFPSPLKVRTGQIGPDGPITLPVTFLEFVHDNLLPQFGKTLRDFRRANQAWKQLQTGEKRGWAYLDSSLLDEMQKICEKREDWNVMFAMQMMTFFDAIENATKAEDVEPTELKVVEGGPESV